MTKPTFPFLAFCNYVWERMGHETEMSNLDWDGLSVEERKRLIDLWREADRSLEEAKRLWDAQHADDSPA